MRPLDYRNATWESLQEKLEGQRLAALRAWRLHGPGTTRAVAQRAGVDLLSLRPRTTELYQLGLVVVVDPTERASEGIYRALTDAEAREYFAERSAEARATHSGGCQPELKLQEVRSQKPDVRPPTPTPTDRREALTSDR